MFIQTAAPPGLLRHVRSLVSIDTDSAHGLGRAADCVRSQPLARTLRACAVTREEFAAELKLVLRGLGDPDGLGAPLRAHRWWLDLDGVAQRGGDRALLNEVLRAEAPVREAYDAAIRAGTCGIDEVNELLQSQAESVRRIGHQLRILRDAQRFL